METKFQYYNARITDCKPAGWITLTQFIEVTRNPNPKLQAIFNRIAEYEVEGNMAAKDAEKEKLYKFTPCVHIRDWRSYQNIVRFTGLMVLDFDHIAHAPELKQYLFEEYQSIIATWLSPSRRGVKALISIPIVKSVGEFKEYFYGMAAELWNYQGFDRTAQSPVQDLFLSNDPNILFREYATQWNEKGIYSTSIAHVQTSPPPVSPSGEYERKILRIIDAGLDKIIDNGHPQLRDLCLAVGGYVASGYIDPNTAQQYINCRITNHSYLRKGIAGYQKTAQWAINEGQKKPIPLKNYTQ